MCALTRKRYISAFGVYQGIFLPLNPLVVKLCSLLQIFTPCSIYQMNHHRRYRESCLQLWHVYVTRNLLDSWIGGTNVFLALALGLVAGTLYDRGYLYVPTTSGVVRRSMLFVPSYHLLIGGSLLQSFTLFMLSLTKPGQYYQVRHSATNILNELSQRVGMTGLSCSRDRPRCGSGDSVRSDHGSGISVFPPTSHACNEPHLHWILTRIGCPSHHVEQLV